MFALGSEELIVPALSVRSSLPAGEMSSGDKAEPRASASLEVFSHLYDRALAWLCVLISFSSRVLLRML